MTNRGANLEKTMAIIIASCLATLVAFFSSPVQAALNGVSGYDDSDTALVRIVDPNDAPDVAYSLAHGFPIWYEDADGLQLELCLDRQVEISPGVFIEPCLLENNPDIPLSFPGNFGNEAFWWAATTFGVFFSRQDGNLITGGDALLELALEAAFGADLGVLDGDQVAFGRIRLRISLPVAGTYFVEHPYGSFTYTVDPGRRAINQTQDIGNFLLPGPPPAGDFTAALFDGPPPTLPVPFDPAVSAGIVNADGRTIGPFLRPAPAGEILALDGRRYIANPGTEIAPVVQPVTGAPNGNFNGLRITLNNPPDGFFLNGLDNSQVLAFTDFQVMGKIFNDAPNQRPIAEDDRIGTGVNQPVRIDVAANDTDPVGGDNVHGINPQAIGLPVDQSEIADLRAGILLTQPLTTSQGGTVRRFTTIITGETVFLYTPPTDFVGEDTFYYVIQDTGGLISEPALVTVIVEALSADVARYRTRLGKWSISGTSSDTTENTLALTLSPRAVLSGAEEVPAVATGARGLATLLVTEDIIEFRLNVNPPTAGVVTQAHIHVGAPDENGPILFFLYDDVIEPPFTGQKTGLLNFLNLIPRPEQGVISFSDAVAAILDGRTYVNVHTTHFPEGEIRGQLEVLPFEMVDVGPDGRWRFEGKSATSPGGAPWSVNVESSNGVRVLGVPLEVR